MDFHIPYLGRLKIIETWVYYDQPLLFSCKNEHETLFIGVASDKTETAETWLYVKLSQNRLEKIRSGNIDLHDAFAKPENNMIVEVKYIYECDSDYPEIRCLKPFEVSKDFLPVPGEFLNLDKTQENEQLELT